MEVNKPLVIFLLGPTASGKTNWAIHWHKTFPEIEIISVDSVMVYQGCNIGSAKPSIEVLTNHPHHLIDIVTLGEIFSVSDFCQQANNLISNIHKRKKIPLLVGGSMMYFNVLKKGINKLPSSNKNFREKLYARLNNEGIEKLYEELYEIDKKAAIKIQKKDTQRIVRALEIAHFSRDKYKENTKQSELEPLVNKYNLFEYGIFPTNRAELHSRIEQRQHELISGGLIDETKSLIDKYNVPAEHPAMKAINYRQALQVLNGKLKGENLFKKSLYATRQLAKRQFTWMRGWKNLNHFDLNDLDMATIQLKNQLNLDKIV